jgi:carboxymethylenebutenolidase
VARQGVTHLLLNSAMCFDIDSAPPVPVIAGAALSHDDLVLTSADDTEFAAFLATPDEPGKAGIVILPDVRGLYRFYEELALRFAERGYTALALDYFGRTAGAGKRDDEFEYRPHVDQTTDAGIQSDTRAAVEHLRGLGVGSVFTVGFCFGGRASWVAGASGHGLAGAVGFYGSPTRERGGPSVVQRANEIAAPILALQAGDDQNITAEDNAEFDRALTDAGVEHEIVTYDGAPHSFFDRKQDAFAEPSDDAWRRTLAFVDRHS